MKEKEKKPSLVRAKKDKPKKPKKEVKAKPEAEPILDVSAAEKTDKSDYYFEAVGKRKTSVARVRLYTQGDKDIIINDKKYEDYFNHTDLQQIVISALDKMKCLGHFRIIVRIYGGGIHSQAEAVRHGISRALVKFNPDFRKRLRRAGYITRDPRARERKKFGLKRARRAPQWSKR
jgi:small subunit ribosomal protein S9